METTNNPMKMSKQCRLVLEYLYENGSITHHEADRELGIARLAARIFDLASKYGYAFDREIVYDTNRRGEPVHYARYRLAV